jgi:hypothetical protein
VARKLVVELIADPRGYTAGLQTAAKQTKVFGAEMDKATRGILSGTGALHGLGRSLAFASGGFLAFEGVSRFLEDSVSAARDAGVAQRSLAAQVKAAGDSFAGNQAAITKAELSLEKFGFTSEDSAQALTVLERGTGNITKAIGLQSTAADLARAKNIDLASAANVLAKVFGGQETALRRAVPGLDKNAHGLDLIREAQQRLAGQAKAGTTEAERFHATLHDTEVIIGTALLPTLNKFLTSLGDWLQKMNESGRLQKDVNEVVKTGTGIFEGVLAVVKPLATAFQDLGKAVGGTKNEVKLLAAAFAAFKVSKLIGGLATVGSTAATSAGEVTALRGALSRLAGIGLITIPIEILLNKGAIDKSVSGFLDSHGLGFLGGTNRTTADDPRLAGTFPELARKLQQQGLGVPGLAGPSGATSRGLGGPVGAPSVNVPGRVAGAAFQNAALSATQARAIGLASDPNNLALLRAQAAHDQAAIAFAAKLRSSGRISNAKYVAEVTGYTTDLQQTNATVAGILQAAAQAAADKTQAAAEKTKAAAEAARAAAAKAQQGLLDRFQLNVDRTQLTTGLKDDLSALQAQKAGYQEIIRTEGATHDLLETLLGVELAISAKKQEIADARAGKKQAQADKAAKQVQAKLDAANLLVAKSGLTETLKDDLAANKNLLATMKATGAAAIDVVNQQKAINDVKAQLADQIAAGKKTDDKAADTAAQAAQSSLRLFHRLSASGFVNRFGAGLSRAQKQRLEVGFAMTGPGGTLPAGHSGQFTAGVTIHGGVHMHGVHDVAGLENELAKRAKARPAIRRGTRG